MSFLNKNTFYFLSRMRETVKYFFQECSFTQIKNAQSMKLSIILKSNLLFSAHIAIIFLGSICIIYLVYKIWKRR
jgi:hypothetical protein